MPYYKFAKKIKPKQEVHFLKKLFSFLTVLFLAGVFTLSAQQALPFSESFDGTAMPTGWTVDEGATIWEIVTTNAAGGTANELRARWQSYTGTTRCYTPALDVDGISSIALSFKYYFQDYDAGATVKVQYSANGLTWTDSGWEIVSGNGSAGPATANILIDNSAKAASLMIAFVTDGDHYQFDYWFIDDVLVEEAASYDVTISNMTGNSMVQIGESFYYQLRVNNAGSTDDDYTFSVSKAWADGLYADASETPLPVPLTVTAGNYADVYLKVTVPGAAAPLSTSDEIVQVSGTGVSDSVTVTTTAMNWWLNEEFTDGYDGWNIYQMGYATAVNWDWNSNGYMIHGWTAAGEAADNWLVSPKITIEPASKEGAVVLYFWYAWTEPTYYVYHGLWASVGSGDPADGDFFEIVELAPTEDDPGYFYAYAYDFSAFAGYDLHLAFVYQGEDADLMAIDNVMVYDEGFEWPADYPVTLTSFPEAIGATLTGAGNYAQGATVNISAAPVKGYHFLEWDGLSCDVALLDDPYSPNASFTMPYRAVDLVAVFEEIPEYTVTLLADPSDIGVILSGAGDYEIGSDVNISATLPEKGHVFVEWQGSVDDVALLADPLSASTSFTMPERAVELTAHFEEESTNYTQAAISLENEGLKGVWLWSYSPTKSPYIESKGSSWTKILANITASKIMAGDITGDSILDVVALLDGYGLWYYNLATASWSQILNNAAGCSIFTLAKTTASGPVEVVATMSGLGLRKWTFGGTWTSLHAWDAEVLAAGDLNRDVDAIDELVVVFEGYPRLFVYDFGTAAFSMVIQLNPSQAEVGDVTGDGYNEIACVFDGVGTFFIRYIPDKGMDMKKSAEINPEFDLIRDIPRNHEWVSKDGGSKGWQFNRITYGCPAAGHSIALGDINGTSGMEIIFTYINRTYAYSYDAKAWSCIILAPMKKLTAGKFTGGAKDDLIATETSTGSVFLRIAATGTWESIAAYGDSNAMTAIE